MKKKLTTFICTGMVCVFMAGCSSVTAPLENETQADIIVSEESEDVSEPEVAEVIAGPVAQDGPLFDKIATKDDSFQGIFIDATGALDYKNILFAYQKTAPVISNDYDEYFFVTKDGKLYYATNNGGFVIEGVLELDEGTDKILKQYIKTFESETQEFDASDIKEDQNSSWSWLVTYNEDGNVKTIDGGYNYNRNLELVNLVTDYAVRGLGDIDDTAVGHDEASALAKALSINFTLNMDSIQKALTTIHDICDFTEITMITAGTRVDNSFFSVDDDGNPMVIGKSELITLYITADTGITYEAVFQVDENGSASDITVYTLRDQNSDDYLLQIK